MEPEIVPAFDRKEELRALFTEYTDMLIAGDSKFSGYLVIQNYEEEVAHPEKKYGPPGGRLYLAYVNGQLAGCIGMRRLDAENCELKRLYVKPAFRGNGLGKKLIDRIVSDAREVGYRHLVLDTLPFLKTALRIYGEYGFYETESYNGSPMENLIYLRLDL